METEETRSIRRLVERYARLVDERRFDDLGEVFAPDAVLETGQGVRTGLGEIRAAMAGLHRYDRTDHRVGGNECGLDGATGTGTVECVAHHWFVDDDRPVDHQMTITYHDRYVATGGDWRIAHRRLEIHRAETVDADEDR